MENLIRMVLDGDSWVFTTDSENIPKIIKNIESIKDISVGEIKILTEDQTVIEYMKQYELEGCYINEQKGGQICQLDGKY